MLILVSRLIVTGALAMTLASARTLDSQARGSYVFVNGMPVMKLLAAEAGASASDRAATISRILRGLSSDSTIDVRDEADGSAVTAGSRVLILVDHAEADSHHTNSAELARSWALNIREALALPPLKLDVGDVTVPLGSTKTLSLQGSMIAEANAESNAPRIATAQSANGYLTIRGTGPGYATVTITAGDARLYLNVHVQPWAAELPQKISAEVVGSPAAGSTVLGSIEYALRTWVTTRPHGTARFALPESARSLEPGQTASYVIRCVSDAPDALEAAGTVTVLVRNNNLPTSPDSELWVDDDPERIKLVGPLFSAFLQSDEKVRLLYHHYNSTTQPLFVRVQAVNDNPEVARLAVIPGDSEPDKDPVEAGVRAGDRFLHAWAKGSAEVLSIPPHSTVPISLRRLDPGETSSGLCSLHLVGGPDQILIRVDAWPPFSLEKKWQEAVASAAPWRLVGANPVNDFDVAPFQSSIHIYPKPYRTEDLVYQVGGRFGSVRIGQKPISGSSDEASALDGNFGVMVAVHVALSNPTSRPRDVELVVEASAGYSGGLFLIDGSLFRCPLLKPKAQARIKSLRLYPGEKRAFDITTIPLSGSSYPETLILRPVATGSGGMVVECVRE